MTRTFNINLGGRLFVIDDEAYTLLLDYLDTLHKIFDPRGEAEVVDDIEARVSELLAIEMETSPSPSITLSMAKSVIERIGRPEDLVEEIVVADDQGETIEVTTREAPAGAVPPPYQPDVTVHKKFFRDPSNKIIGGVCSGLAAYLGIDVTIIRVLVVVLCFCSLATVGIVYLVLCIVVPEAKTPIQKMEMYGESPTIENIGKTVAAGFTSAVNTAKENKGVLVSILNFLGKCFLILFLIIAIPIGFATGIGAISCLIGLLVLLFASLFSTYPLGEMWLDSWVMSHGGVWSLLTAFFICTSVAIPAIALVIGSYRSLRHQKVSSLSTVILWSVIWVVCMVCSGIFFKITEMRNGGFHDLMREHTEVIMERADELMEQADELTEQAVTLAQQADTVAEKAASL